MSIFLTLIFGKESDPEFKRALRGATAAQLREAIRLSGEEYGAGRRLGRLRAALRRAERREYKK